PRRTARAGLAVGLRLAARPCGMERPAEAAADIAPLRQRGEAACRRDEPELVWRTAAGQRLPDGAVRHVSVSPFCRPWLAAQGAAAVPGRRARHRPAVPCRPAANDREAAGGGRRLRERGLMAAGGGGRGRTAAAARPVANPAV